MESTDGDLEAACMAELEGANRRKQRPSYPGLFNLKVMGSQGSHFKFLSKAKGAMIRFGFQKDNTRDSIGIYQIEGRDGLVGVTPVVQMGENGSLGQGSGSENRWMDLRHSKKVSFSRIGDRLSMGGRGSKL